MAGSVDLPLVRIVFAGTPEAALPSLEHLLDSARTADGRDRHEVVGVLTRPDARVGRGRKLRPSPVKERATELGLPVRMRLVDFAFVGVEPEVMGYGPVPAAEKALAKAGLTIDDIGLFELNEAFAVQVLAFLENFGIADDSDKVNRYGGAIATGHPLASSAVRLMNQLARQFEEHPEVRYGLTAMCIGIGMGGAGVGVGSIFGNYLAAALRNPSAAQGQFGNLIFGFAVTEALGIFSLLIALLLLFAV